MEIFSFSFLAHTCFAWTFTSIKLTLYMLCFSCTEIPLQYLPYLYTDITIPFPFFCKYLCSFAYLSKTQTISIYLFVLSLCLSELCVLWKLQHISNNPSQSWLQSQAELQSELHSHSLSASLSQSASSFQSLSSLSLSSVCIFTMCTRIWFGIWPVWIHVAGN